jgi:hypothetical protein
MSCRISTAAKQLIATQTPLILVRLTVCCGPGRRAGQSHVLRVRGRSGRGAGLRVLRLYGHVPAFSGLASAVARRAR